MQCPCAHTQVSAELHATVQRLYVETLGRLDNALTTICGHFDAQRYSKVRLGASGCSGRCVRGSGYD